MSTILSVATHATDDQTKATLAFVTAVGALGAKKKVQLALLGEAAYLAMPAVAKTVNGVGFPPLQDLIDKLVGAEVEIFV